MCTDPACGARPSFVEHRGTGVARSVGRSAHSDDGGRTGDRSHRDRVITNGRGIAWSVGRSSRCAQRRRSNAGVEQAAWSGSDAGDRGGNDPAW